MSRIAHVQSVDGTRIGYRTTGSGPPLVLVHGASADSTVMSLLIPLLERHYTVHALDRRGRGLSDDAPTYDITLRHHPRVRRHRRRRRRLCADSRPDRGRLRPLLRGRLRARHGVTLPQHRRLFLYEPGFGAVLSPRPEVLDRVDELAAAGRNEATLQHFYREAVGMTVDDVAAMRQCAGSGSCTSG